jgi:sugar lactone lactonase YvrE
MRKLFSVIAVLLVSATCLFAEGTHTWEQSSYDDLEQGTAQGVAIRSQGGIELAPAFAPVFTTPSTYIWSIADDGQGNVYAAAGSPARVYRITPEGQASIVFQPSELQVQALVVGKDGVIYAATSPDGKVYKIQRTSSVPASASQRSRTSRNEPPAPPSQPADPHAFADPPQQPDAVPVDPNYKATVLFDPETKYIWDLALDSQGQLYVATGDQGEIFRVPRDGQPTLFFKSDEAHIRVLAFDPKGNLIAGSDGSGLVYRISPSGQGFVLYSAEKKEITALAIDGSGNIYAAAVGEKRASPAPTQAPQSVPISSTTITVTASPAGPTTTQKQTTPQFSPAPVLPVQVFTGGSDVYRIAPDGSPKQLWTSPNDVVYALAFDQDRLIIGTGGTGRIYAVSKNGDSIDLVKASANQVSALTRAASGGLYAGTSNLGKVFRLRAVPDAQGTYESDVFDAKIFSRWGRAEVRGSGHFDLYARSGNVDNPDRNWSPWQKLDFGGNEGKLNIPPARFVQWKAVLFAGTPTPVVDSVTLNYLPKNVAPEISDIAVQPGARFQETPRPVTQTVVVNVGQQDKNAPSQNFQAPVPAIRDRDYIALRWTATDGNDDDLVYSLYYRGDKESRWKLLKGGIEDPYYSFEAALLPDGGYQMMVVASDAPSHSPDEALTASKVSSHFEVDTTPPQVQNLSGTFDGDSLRVSFRAVDGFSPLQRAEYSIDAGPWQYLDPVGGLSDYRVQEYSFSVPLAAATAPGQALPAPKAVAASDQAPAEHVVVVRVYDRFDNMSSAKTVVRK